MNDTTTRSRTAFQAVPTDHPSVVALLAMEPVLTDEMKEGLAAATADRNAHVSRPIDDMLEGLTLLACAVMPDGDERDASAVLREDTGRLVLASWSIGGRPSFGSVGIAGVDYLARLICDWPDPAVPPLFAAMADAPWIDQGLRR